MRRKHFHHSFAFWYGIVNVHLTKDEQDDGRLENKNKQQQQQPVCYDGYKPQEAKHQGIESAGGVRCYGRGIGHDR